MRPIPSSLCVRLLLVGFSVALMSLSGCGNNGPKTYPVRGKVVLAGADVSVLADSHVELALASDNTIRASGTIQSDGSFVLQTNHGGDILLGAREGKYQVRLILSDDDRAVRQRAAKSLAKRYLDFRASGLTIEVPTAEDVTLTVSAK